MLVPGTEGLDYLGGRSFSISPDSRWLLFARDSLETPPDPNATFREFMTRTYESYVVVDLLDQSARRLSVGRDVLDYLDREVTTLHRGGCWIPMGDRWHGSMGMAVGGHLGFDPHEEEARWHIFPVESEVVRAACPIEDPYLFEPTLVGRFMVEEVRGRRVVVVDADRPGQVLAEHGASGVFGSVSISHVRLAPDGTRIAYIVNTESLGFARDSQGWVLERGADGPRLHFLSPHVSAPQWSPDGGALYANAWDSTRTPAVFRWPIPPRLEGG